MGGTYTTFGIGVTLLIMVFTVLMWGMTDLASNYNVTVEDVYQDSTNPVISDGNQNLQVLLESQEIAKESSLDEDATDTAQAQGDISAIKNTAQSSNILQGFLKQFNEMIPYHPAINVALIAILVILFISASLYIIIGRKP